MIRTIAALMMTAILVSGAAAQGNQAEKQEEKLEFKRYGVERLTVRYRISGAQEGMEELSFDRYGMRERKRSTTVMFGQETRTLVIVNGLDMYSIDEGRKQGDRIETPMIKEFLAQGKTDLADGIEEMMREMGGAVAGTEMIVGKEATLWELPQMRVKVWMWKGVALRTVNTMPGMETTIEAYEIDEKPTLKDSDFLPPEGVVINDAGTVEELFKQGQ